MNSGRSFIGFLRSVKDGSLKSPKLECQRLDFQSFSQNLDDFLVRTIVICFTGHVQSIPEIRNKWFSKRISNTNK